MLRYLFALSLFLTLPSVHAAAIATAHPIATQAGISALKEGGNAFDAAAAITAALAVAEPYSSGIGGGGFYLLYISSESRYVFVDAREKAPLSAHKDMYLDAQGVVQSKASIDGPLAAGIPGIVAALEHLSTRYGKRTLSDNLQPAITAAIDGFTVDAVYQRLANWRLPILKQHAPLFLEGNDVPPIGALIKQPDLARSLQTIAKQGAQAFYQGDLAKEMVNAVRAHGGIWSMQDLAQYTLVERDPIQFKWRGNTIYSAPPPSSGGVALAQILQQLEALPPAKNNSEQLHYLIESMRRAYRDRALYLGDSDFVDIPLKRLTNKDYAAGLAASIHPEKASRSSHFSVQDSGAGGNHTTHFSVIDEHGNRVAATLSINYPFGSGFIAGRTGILLNDEMDDFVAKPNSPNAYGLVGGKANAIEPGKRMLSSMTPTILEMEDRTVVLGTPGGSRIITMVLLGLLEAEQGNKATAIVGRKRIHHQFLPDQVLMEDKAISASEQQQLKAMGHQLKMQSNWGNMQVVIEHKNGAFEAASDSRGVGQSWVDQ